MATLKGLSDTDRFLVRNLPKMTEAAHRAVSVVPQNPDEVLLNNLLLPARIVNLLRAPIEALGFSPTQAEHYDDMLRFNLQYYQVPARQGNAVLLYGAEQVLRFTQLRRWVAMLGPTFSLAEIQARRLFIFSLVEVGILRPYKTLAYAWRQRFPEMKMIAFFGLEDLSYWESLPPVELKNEIRISLGLDPHEMTPMLPAVGAELTDAEQEHVIRLLATQAARSLSGPRAYLRDLIARANLPERLEIQAAGGLTGDATIAARQLIQWALPKGPHPERPETTILGCVLAALRQDVSDALLEQLIAR